MNAVISSDVAVRPVGRPGFDPTSELAWRAAEPGECSVSARVSLPAKAGSENSPPQLISDNAPAHALAVSGDGTWSAPPQPGWKIGNSITHQWFT
jgi:hypothetical protein